MGRRPSGLVQQGYLHPVWIGVGQEEVESFRKVCRGHQRALKLNETNCTDIFLATMAVVVSELLCYFFSKYGNSDVESIKKTVVNFYNSGEITAAKELLYKCIKESGVDNDGLPRQVSRRKADNRAAVEVDDIVSLIETLDEKLLLEKLPVFTAQKLDRLPSNKLAEMDLFLAVRRIATLEEKLDLVMQQCSELASAVAGSKFRAPDVQNNGFITGHADLDNGEQNSVKPAAAAGACDGGSSWASCCARPSVNDDGVFTEVSYKKAVKAPVQQKVVQVVRGTKKTMSGNAVISGVPRRLTAFVGRLHIDTTEDDLTKFLNDAGLNEVKCKRLKPKDGQQFSTAAFFVSCPAACKELFHNEDTWPEGCELRDWYFKRGPPTA